MILKLLCTKYILRSSVPFAQIFFEIEYFLTNLLTMKNYLLLSILILSTAFQMHSQHRYLALGDSYTIGESVPSESTWPFLLTEHLVQQGFDISQPRVIARTGWRTDELINALEVADLKPESFDMVSLMIGVNNQYQEKPIEQFSEEFRILLQKAIAYDRHGSKTTFVVGIPDYSITPYAARNDKKDADKEVKRYNKIIREICKEYDVEFYPIFKLSQRMRGSSEMFVEDELHPSAEQYEIWFRSFRDKVVQLAKNMK